MFVVRALEHRPEHNVAQVTVSACGGGLSLLSLLTGPQTDKHTALTHAHVQEYIPNETYGVNIRS